MNRVFISASLVLLWLSPHATAQAAFQNLGFESATRVPIPGDHFERVEFGPALPGWIGYLGDVPQSLALYDLTFLSGPGIGVLDSAWPYRGLIQGDFTVFLQPVVERGVTPIDASLAQTGLIPGFAKSLRFNAIPYADPYGYGPQAGDPGGTFSVMLGGQVLPVFALGSGPNNSILFGVDVDAWAGQTTELRFTTFAAPGGQLNRHNNLFLDSIRFSAVPVPEPGIVSLFALAGLLCGLARWRSRLKR